MAQNKICNDWEFESLFHEYHPDINALYRELCRKSNWNRRYAIYFFNEETEYWNYELFNNVEEASERSKQIRFCKILNFRSTFFFRTNIQQLHIYDYFFLLDKRSNTVLPLPWKIISIDPLKNEVKAVPSKGRAQSKIFIGDHPVITDIFGSGVAREHFESFSPIEKKIKSPVLI